MPIPHVRISGDSKQHRIELSQKVNKLLLGYHNEIHDVTITDWTTLTRFPIQTGAAITAFAAGAAGWTTATSNGHGLSDGDLVVVNKNASYEGTYPVANTAANTFDFQKAFIGGGTGLWWWALTHPRITPDTVPVLLPVTANAFALAYAANYIVPTMYVGYIEFVHDLNAAVDLDFKLILFGD
jgi:hypothetical protein